MNGLIRNITNHSQNIISHVIEYGLRKFQLSNIKRDLIHFKISITKRVMKKRKSGKVTFSHMYGYLPMIHMQCILNHFYQKSINKNEFLFKNTFFLSHLNKL